MSGYIYAILAANGLVKIGFSTNPRGRVSKINSDASSPCKLIAAIEGSQRTEAQIHLRLSAHRVYGEWYRVEGLVKRLIEQMPAVSAAGEPSRGNLTPDLLMEIAMAPMPIGPEARYSLDTIVCAQATKNGQHICMIESRNGLLHFVVSARPDGVETIANGQSPIPLRLIGKFNGGGSQKLFLQESFEETLERAGWYRIEGSLSEFVRKHRGCGGISISEWEDLAALTPEDRLSLKEATRRKRSESMKRAWQVPGAREGWFAFGRKRSGDGASA